MECNSLTPLLIYKDLYASSYKDLIKYGLTPDQASRKANIYCVKNTWRFFTSEDKEAKFYRTMFYAKFYRNMFYAELSKCDKAGLLSDEEVDRLLELKEANETVSWLN